MARMRYNGPEPADLPEPFNFHVEPGGVVEIPLHMRHLLHANILSFGTVTTAKMPPAHYWTDTADEQPAPVAEAEPEAEDPKARARKPA